MEQIVDSRVVGEGLQDFRPGQSSSPSEHVPARVHEDADELVKVFFRTFLQNKKSAKSGPHSGSELSADFTSDPPRQLMWTLGSTATTSGSASTPCKGHTGGSCCQTTGSGTGLGNGTDGSTVTMRPWVRLFFGC